MGFVDKKTFKNAKNFFVYWASRGGQRFFGQTHYFFIFFLRACGFKVLGPCHVFNPFPHVCNSHIIGKGHWIINGLKVGFCKNYIKLCKNKKTKSLVKTKLNKLGCRKKWVAYFILFIIPQRIQKIETHIFFLTL